MKWTQLMFPGLAVFAASGSASAAPLMQRPGSVWGQVPVEPEGLVFGGPEVLAGLLIGLLVVLLLIGFALWQARRLLRRASGVEGFEAEFLFLRAEKVHRRTAWVVYGPLPLLGIAGVLAAPRQAVFGFGVSELALGLFLLGSLLGGATFLVVEAVRRDLGSERA